MGFDALEHEALGFELFKFAGAILQVDAVLGESLADFGEGFEGLVEVVTFGLMGLFLDLAYSLESLPVSFC